MQRLLPVLGLVAVSVHFAGAQRPIDLVNRHTLAEVVGVTDGDTVDVLIKPDRRVRVRLHGVDAPESAEPFSQQARNFTRVLVFSKSVTISGRDVDTYGRLVARIIVDGTDVSTALLSAGLACHYRRYSDDPKLEAAEEEARMAARGFWAPSAPKPACVARETAGAKPEVSRAVGSGFVGNTNSHVFHLPTCRNASCKNCTRKFVTRQEAERAGFRPAGDCIPR